MMDSAYKLGLYQTVFSKLLQFKIYAKADNHRDLYELLRWTVSNTNAFFRGVNIHGLWIPHAEAKRLVQHAWNMTAALHG